MNKAEAYQQLFDHTKNAPERLRVYVVVGLVPYLK